MSFNTEINVEEENNRVREEAEQILRAGQVYRPKIKFYREGIQKGEIQIRNVENEADKRVAFTEACMLIPFLRADEISLSFDDFISTKPGVMAVDDPERHEAVCVIIANDIGAMAVISPYIRDEQGDFDDWGQRQENINPTSLDEPLVHTIAHFMQYDSGQPRYASIMVRTLQRRGHLVEVAEGSHYRSNEDIVHAAG